MKAELEEQASFAEDEPNCTKPNSKETEDSLPKKRKRIATEKLKAATENILLPPEKKSTIEKRQRKAAEEAANAEMSKRILSAVTSPTLCPDCKHLEGVVEELRTKISDQASALDAKRAVIKNLEEENAGLIQELRGQSIQGKIQLLKQLLLINKFNT